MLRSLEIENFKGVAEAQRIDFAPLTLLFGANSAGKSTVLQALAYLNELLEHGSADVTRTQLGGSAIDLGGFARLVHKHELGRTVRLRAEFTTPGRLDKMGRSIALFDDLDDEIESAWVDLSIVHRTTPVTSEAVVWSVSIGVNGVDEPLVMLNNPKDFFSNKTLDHIFAAINLEHPTLATITDVVREDWEAAAFTVGQVAREIVGIAKTEQPTEGFGFDDRSLPSFLLRSRRRGALPPTDEPLHVVSENDAKTLGEVRAFLEMVVLGTLAQLADDLRDAIYIGPLRMIPERSRLFIGGGDRRPSWADGLAAWNVLLSDSGVRVEQTNKWLRRLDAGCQVIVQQLFDTRANAEELSRDDVDKTVRRLLLDTGMGAFSLPTEVGAGISQVVPVVVAGLEERAGLTMIEQPELHIHPRLQTNLGDLFLVAAERRQFLIETHSEHLILRALRRIRETSAGELNEADPPFTPDKLSVIYVQATPTGTTFKRLRVDETGEFVDRWPHGFFEERAKELF
ncbi:MAG: AAA family ATPase [Kofleriaceae bacterium]